MARRRKYVDVALLRDKLVKIAGYTPEQVNTMSYSELQAAWTRYLLFKETSR